MRRAPLNATLLTATLFTGLVGLSFGITSPAKASITPDTSFYPAKAWSVGSIAPQSQSDKMGECAIQNEFNNGFLLRFNGNERWVDNLQIDFRQRIFDDNQSYSVKMTVPGKSTVTMSAVTQGGNALKIDFKTHKEFYQSLKSGGVFDMNLEGNEFRFYMTGFNAHSGKFENCMADSASEPQAPDIIVPTNLSAAIPDVVVNESVFYEAEELSAAAYDEPEQGKEDRPWLFELFDKSEKIPPADGVETVEYAPQEIAQEAAQTAPTQISKSSATATTTATALAKVTTPTPITEPVAVKTAAPETQADIIADLADFMATPAQPKTQIQTSISTGISEPLLEPVTGFDPVSASSLAPAPTAKASLRPAPVINNYKSPEIKVTRETGYAEMDIRAQDIRNKQQDDHAVKELRAQLARLEAKNQALNEELEVALTTEIQEKVSISTDNWNLERATMRFNEAERQLKTIGRQLQRERTSCSVEKRELEAMLFDPALTDESQISALADLEMELANTKAELRALKSR